MTLKKEEMKPSASWMSSKGKIPMPPEPKKKVKPKVPDYPAPSFPQGHEKTDAISRNTLPNPPQGQDSSLMPISLPVGLPVGRTAANKVIKLGNFVSLVELDALEQFFSGLTRNAALRMLRTFEIPLIYIGDKGYFNLHTFERVFYYLTLPNRNSFAMPGSAKKNQIFKKRNTPKGPGLEEKVDIELTASEKEYIRKLERLNTPNIPAKKHRGRPYSKKPPVSEGELVK